MKQLKQPQMKPPKDGLYCFKVEGYTFQRPTMDQLVEVVHAYLSQNIEVDIEALRAEIEDSVCEQNRHMPQRERKT